MASINLVNFSTQAHSQHGGVLRTKMKVSEAVKMLIRRLNTRFQLVKKRTSPVVAYENINKRVANALGLLF